MYGPEIGITANGKKNSVLSIIITNSPVSLNMIKNAISQVLQLVSNKSQNVVYNYSIKCVLVFRASNCRKASLISRFKMTL
jgi:hypothetical protein